MRAQSEPTPDRIWPFLFGLRGVFWWLATLNLLKMPAKVMCPLRLGYAQARGKGFWVWVTL